MVALSQNGYGIIAMPHTGTGILNLIMGWIRGADPDAYELWFRVSALAGTLWFCLSQIYQRAPQ
eukprot:8476527-Heterocapsa_arctica.AAC.1